MKYHIAAALLPGILLPLGSAYKTHRSKEFQVQMAELRLDQSSWEKYRCPTVALESRSTKERYLADLSDVIAKQNASHFRGLMPSQHLCFLSSDEEEIFTTDAFYAFAIVASRHFGAIYQRGTLIISPQIVRTAASDAVVASVLSHELAHFVLNHGDRHLGDSSSPWYALQMDLDKLEAGLEEIATARTEALWHMRNDSVPGDWPAQLEARDAEMESYESNINAERTALKSKIKKLQEDAYGIGYVANWKEQQADELGYLFYLNAGFKPELYTFFHEIAAHDFLKKALAKEPTYSELHPTPEKDNLLSMCQATTIADEPLRGTSQHPAPCWRLWNIAVRNGQILASEYSRLLGSSPQLTNILPGRLEDAQED